MKLELLELPDYSDFLLFKKEDDLVYLVHLVKPKGFFFYEGKNGRWSYIPEAVYRVVAGVKVGVEQDKQHWWELPAPKKKEPSCGCSSDSACGDSCNCGRVSDETNRFWNELGDWQPGGGIS